MAYSVVLFMHMHIPYSMGTPTPRAYSGDPLFYGDSSARAHSYATGKHVIRRGAAPQKMTNIIEGEGRGGG